MHYPLVVIGAGAGGLVVAIGAAKAGKKVLLIENGNYGGDCTNFGCIPSKATIAAAHAAHAMTKGSALGLSTDSAGIDSRGAMERTRAIVKHVRSHEEPEALKSHGVETRTGVALFLDAHTLKIQLLQGEEDVITADSIVIATGSRPRLPSFKGAEEGSFLTNETIFDLKEVPKALAVIGGGPIGCELAQAFHRLGSEVSVIHRHKHLLNKEIPGAQKIIEGVFREEGIALYLDTEPVALIKNEAGTTLKVKNITNDLIDEVRATHILVSAGRVPNIEALNLDAVGIEYTVRGIAVDAYGRTNIKNIWAVGDVAGRALFTHLAENEGRAVLTSLLLPGFLKKKLDRKQPIPRVTYTDPEVASLGLSAEEAAKKYGTKKIAVYHIPLADVDRAITTGRTEGFIEIVTKKWSSRILGATIVAPRAGEMLMEVSTAMFAGLPLRKLASLIHPYPTYNQGIRKAADQWLTATVLPFLKQLAGKKR